MSVHTEQDDMELFVKRIGDFLTTVRDDIKPSWIKLTTITLVSSHLKDNGTKLNLDKLRMVFSRMKFIPIQRENSKSCFKWKLFESSFYNQVTIGYHDSLSTKKVKVFPNGSMQIAGCRDLDDCKRFITQLRMIIQLVYNVDVPYTSFRIVMINSNFSLNHIVNQMNILNVFNTRNFIVSFDPDRYSAVKMKFTPIEGGKQVTVSIFSSGSVIITGAQRIEEVCQAYITIINKITARHNDVYVEKSESVKNFDHFMGYTYTEWYQKIISSNLKNVH
jgi:TATA-box binding protein (TBP) (component of TFIID and TFIIIB)